MFSRQMRTVATVLLLGLFRSAPAMPNRPMESPTEQSLKAMLFEFLEAAGKRDKVVFNRFFAEDVIYTRSTGIVRSKADIMKSLDEPQTASERNSTYQAEQVTVREFGDNLAVVNFRLGQRPVEKTKTEVNYFRNTGTLLRRNGQWQVIAWQSTRIADEKKQKN